MIRRIDVKKLPLIALSFIIAVFIWASAMEVKNPVVDSYEIKGINVRINNIEKGPALADMSVIDGENQKINLIVTGRRNDITAIDASKIVAGVDVSLISKAGDYSLPVDVDLNNAGISIVEKRPSTLSIYIDEIQSKTLPVQVSISGNVSENAEMGDYTKKPESITITGPKGELDNVVSAVSYVEIPKNETKNFGVRQNIILTDKNGDEVTSRHITKSSQYVDVYVPVLSKSSMQVQVNTTGSLDLHYELSTVTISPSIVGVAGNEDALAAAGNIITETVDITGLTESSTISRAITLPEGVKNVSGINQYEISVAILQRTYQDYIVSRYDLENIHENNVITYEPANITVRIWGMADKLAQIDETSISGVIDLKGQYYEPGTYTVSLGIKVPDSSLSGFIAVEGEYTITIEVVDK